MRKLVFAINVTADGYCDHTLGNPDDEVLDYFTKLQQEADIQLYGRKTYELMYPYWPEVVKNHSAQTRAESEFAQAFVSVPRTIVFSRTLKAPNGGNTTIVRSGLQDVVQKLKQEPGKSISTGGVELPSELLKLGLIDEVHLVIHPILAGGGRRLFESANLEETLQLELVESHVFKSGCVALRYLKR